MKPIRRHGVAALIVATAASTGAGVWLHVAGGGPTPSGFPQYAAVALGAAALGAFILWHRPENRYGAAHITVGVLFGTAVLAAGALSRSSTAAALPQWAEELALGWSWISAAALLPLWVIVIAAFPDGRFHRTGVRRATVALAIVMPLLAVVAYLLAPSGEPPPLIRVEPPAGLAGPLAPVGDAHLLHRLAALGAGVLGTLAPVGAVVVLLDRFRAAGPVLRQQIKWLLTGAAISVALQALPMDAIESDALRLLGRTLVLLAVPLPLLAAAFAIFKHRLWEIDVVISKGLVYALASGVLAALFSAVALIAGVSVGGRDARVVAALGLALLVSFLAQPLKKRLERVVARLLYGDQPRGLLALAQLEQLAGLIACGGRPKDPFDDEDVELFAVVTRESALALRNVNLEDELRQRLEQIEQQAAALHRSRQRLVTAQDQERRRIERDLHDGAQQQLVALAARLRQAARGDGPGLDRAVEGLADEAEQAVFALQDLARGIYPSLLVDRGLHAALQGHAARVPANVRVEVEPRLHGRRFASELESALYFLGLEAMTNALKHAPGARIIVSVRADEETQTVALEVHDDGPGFDVARAATGSGLQNMRDRIDALGGVFSVESVPGGGTWVRAQVRGGRRRGPAPQRSGSDALR